MGEDLEQTSSEELVVRRDRIRHSVTVGIAAFVLGLMLITAIQARPRVGKLEAASTSDLVVLLDSLSQRLARLQAEQLTLVSARNEILTGSDKQALARAREQLFAMQVAAGMVPVQGPGVVIRISMRRNFEYDMALSLIQELRDAGAEAIAVNGHRIGTRTSFGQDSAGRLLIDAATVSLPLRVVAVGDRQTLQVALQIPGGVGDTVSSAGGRMTVTAQDKVEIKSVIRPR